MPSVQANIYDLQPGWVIRSDHFANGYHMPDEHGRRVVYIEPASSPIKNAHDVTRPAARFVVEAIDDWTCEHTFNCCLVIDVVARRLKPDGSDDPAGERIRFGSFIGRTDEFTYVEVVGQMTGATMSDTLPNVPSIGLP